MGGDPVPQLGRRRHQQLPQQVELLEALHRPVGHEQHRSGHRQHGHDRGDDELPGQLLDLARAGDALALDRVFGGDRRGDTEARGLDRALQRLGGRDARDVFDGDAFRRLVRRDLDHAGHARQLLLERRDARRVVQVDDLDGDRRLAAVVPGGAHRLDELRDVALLVVVVHGGAGGGVVHRGLRDGVHPLQRFLHRRGAGGAAHPLDGKGDARLSHGTCAATTPPCGWRRPAPRQAAP